MIVSSQPIVLVVAEASPAHRDLLAQAAPDHEFIYDSGADLDDATRNRVEIIVGNIAPVLVPSFPHLTWLALQSAGTDNYSDSQILAPDTILTNGSGVYGLTIAEHQLVLTLMLLRKIPAYLRNQQERQWRKEGEIKSIHGSHVVIVGMGDIGTQFAMRLRSLGARVTGVDAAIKPCPPYLDDYVHVTALDSVLGQADVVSLSVPLLESTYHLMDARRLALMRPDAYLINVGRGPLVDTEALVAALRAGTIAGAALDVIETEPLTPDSPYWDVPGLTITPHVAGNTYLPETKNLYFRFMAANLRAYLAGGRVGNQVPITHPRAD